jgi:hypothetical protein
MRTGNPFRCIVQCTYTRTDVHILNLNSKYIWLRGVCQSSSMNKIFKRGRWRRNKGSVCTFYTIEEERKRKIEKALSKGRGSRACFFLGKEKEACSFWRKGNVLFLGEEEGGGVLPRGKQRSAWRK